MITVLSALTLPCNYCEGSIPVTVISNGKSADVYLPLKLQDRTNERIVVKATVFWTDKFNSRTGAILENNKDTIPFEVRVKY